MKILLAAKFIPSMNPQGGVQTWIKTVEDELVRLGHEVTTWCPRSKSLPLYASFDLGILANPRHTLGVALLCDRVKYISHGIIEEEMPPNLWADQMTDEYDCAYTSEGVRDHWSDQGPIIRQPVDLNFWQPAMYGLPPQPVPRSGIIRYSYRGGLPWLKDVAKKLGHTYEHISNVTHKEAKRKMQGAVCVLATGRAALEAMATGCPVVFVDHRSAYQGELADWRILNQMENNYSGRGGMKPTAENMIDMIESAIQFGSQRFHVEQFHDVKKIVSQLLEGVE